MALSPTCRTLLESAQSQAKRLGHSRVTTAHLALALLKSRPDEARSSWGDISEADICAACFAGVAKGDLGPDPVDREPAEVVELLQAASEGGGVISLLASLTPALKLDQLPKEAKTASRATADEHVAERSASNAVAGAGPTPAPKQPFDPTAARERLKQTVVAQDHAVEAVVKRLVLTRADLDLRPDRPDGVFLFAGPTGVGKTEMAKALGEALYPEASSIIRLDMSEYQDGVMAVAKLIGSGPGFVGHNEPTSWLTTRVIENPNSVILLDEIEKAHPDVWTVFLQVFDDGRLTDGRGQTADFSNSVIIMTSNIGARLFETRSLGFQAKDPVRSDPHDGVVDQIRKTMPPELFNRIDETIVFRALDEADIRVVAEQHIGYAIERLHARGYDVELADGVVDFIAVEGFDPELGARHLLRNVERLLLAEAAARGPGAYVVRAEPGATMLQWETTTA